MPASTHRSRQERLIRYMTRRKPCKYLLLAELGVFIVLTMLLSPVVMIFKELRRNASRFELEDNIYERFIGSITLSHCHYGYPRKNQELCDKQCGSSAYIILLYTNSFDDEKGPTCPLLTETVPCHEKPAQCTQSVRHTQCPGINGMPLFANLSISPASITKVPVRDISKMKGKILSALELVAICPRCRIYSYSYKKADGKCYRQLETVRQGWPEQYYTCDDEGESDTLQCSTEM